MPRRDAHRVARIDFAGPLAKLTGVVLWAAPAVVLAGNQAHKRTPVLWAPEPACVTVIDRSVDPVLHLEYGIPYEDTQVTGDEVDDSRRHQFVAFCRQFRPGLKPPHWLAVADRDAALAKDLIEPGQIRDADLLDRSRAWEGCFERITPDDLRRPITFPVAAEGVDWDTTGLAPGNYVVQGYTWEPPINIYALRPGIVRVLDGPDGDPAFDPGPGIAVRSDDIAATESRPFVMQVCVAAQPGSTWTAQWVRDEELQWQPFDSGSIVDTSSAFEVEFPRLEELAGDEVELRVVVQDPEGREGIGYHSRQVFVAGGSVEDGDGGDGEDAGDGGDDAGGGESGGEASAGGTGDGGGGGCRVASVDGVPGSVWLLGLVALRSRRRRARRW